MRGTGVAVRIPIRLEAILGVSRGSFRETVALVNTGYEARAADCSLPRGAAERLGLWPAPPEAEERLVRGYGGEVTLLKVAAALKIRVADPAATAEPVTAGAFLATGERELLLSDALTGALGIVNLDAGQGIWRLRGEPDSAGRPSRAAELW